MSEKRGMTVQQLADRLTELCHQGKAQAEIRYIGEYEVHDIGSVEMMDEETAIIKPAKNSLDL